MTSRVRLAVSVGCPCGIGPEVSVVAALEMRKRDRAVRVLLVGDVASVRAAARTRGIDPSVIVRAERSDDAWSSRAAPITVLEPTSALGAKGRRPGKPTPASGAAQLAWIDVATDLVSRGEADALVTGPVSKDAIARSGAPRARDFRGHTEHLAARLRAPEVTMAFHTDRLTTSLVTTHLPIARVPRAITPDEVARATFWTASFVDRMARTTPRAKKGARPRLAIAGLNPHAGESGLLGHEEVRAIAPGIAQARKRISAARLGVDVEGPIPAESAFRLAASGAYAAVVAMYHDQATIPMKLLGFGEAVNVSLGLPIIRTSVDHGTAYDRAGKGTADARGMQAAMELAARIARAR